MADLDLSRAADALTAFANGPAQQAAQTIERSLSRSFAVMEKTIAKAAVSGKLSIKDMVDSMVQQMNRVAVQQFVAKPLTGAVSSLVSSLLPVTGARADGGLVSAGASYLVGERGPELFVPSSSGRIDNGAGTGRGNTQLSFNVQTGDAGSFMRSQNQVAAMMLRALRRGQRNL